MSEPSAAGGAPAKTKATGRLFGSTERLLRQFASLFAIREDAMRQFAQAPHLDNACCFRFIHVSNLDIPKERGM